MTLKKTVVKQSEEPLNVSSLTLDVSEEFILSRAAAREKFKTSTIKFLEMDAQDMSFSIISN
ncbi:hypothetical protein M5E02_07720 [Bacillus safensis]|uniref:class I SAM-dependent methyltransferase n=1 Tax=Bacillus safensis TaxID=561879 RepID=UPI002075506D|nr:class I SAM-dependent methyltransferase [Bacillus safensis]USD84278.1 hypothetical protein M5E02_07720 [Bacillus safensis]